MARPKSFLVPLSVDTVAHAHNCQHNSSHRLERGSKRLKVRVKRTYEHFCPACAVDAIDADIRRLTNLRTELLPSP